MSQSKSKRNRKQLWSAATASGLGIDIGQLYTKIVWLEDHSPKRAIATKIPTMQTVDTEDVDCALVSRDDDEKTIDPDRRNPIHNPFKTTRVRQEKSNAWSASHLRQLCQRISQALGDSKIRRSDLSLTLSMSVCDFRSVYVPDDSARNARAIEESLYRSIGDSQKRCIALLPSDDSKSKLRVFSLPETLSWHIGESFETQGLSPRRLDGLPWCLLRAYQQMHPSDASDEIGIIVDWGYGRPTLAAIIDQQIVYTRRLSFGGLGDLASPAMEELGLSAYQATRWLQHCLAPSQDTLHDAVNDTRQWIQHGCRKLAREIRTAVDFTCWQNQPRQVSRICLIGGGAVLSPLTELLHSELDCEISTWRMDTAQGELSAEYATATTLAMLGVNRAK